MTPEAYKPVWADGTMPVFDYLVPITLRGRRRLRWLAGGLDRVAGQRALRRAYLALPLLIRKRVRGALAANWDRVRRLRGL